MSYRGWTPREVTEPSGAWTASGLVRKGTPRRASIAQNMRFAPGKAFSREGTSNVFAAAGAVSSMYDWIAPSAHVLAFQYGNVFAEYRHADGVVVPLYAILPGTSYASSFADLGPRLFWTTYDTTGAGVTQARVWDGSAALDVCFRPPLQVLSATAIDSGVGNCTQGTHRFGFIFQSRNGFAGLPSPVDGSMNFQPVSVTLNAGLRSITLIFTLNTPDDAGIGSAVFPVMTRADNLNHWYFVPGLLQVMPNNSLGYTVLFTVSVSDEDLAIAEDATDQFSVLTQTLALSGPFIPQVVRAYGLRMCYVAGNQLYISEINDAQMIATDRNLVQTAGQRRIATVAALGQTLYLHGDRWTGAINDNGDFPVTWPQPSTVSDAIGAGFPNLVVTQTAGQYHWVIAEGGVYVFDGAYPNRPITYLVSDIWARVNWAAAYSIQGADDVTNLRLSVAIPLDGATAPTHILTIDYTNGITWDTCQISLDNFAFGQFRSIAMVKEQTSNRAALWIGPAAAGNVVHLDPTTHNDVGSSEHPVWESGYIRDGNEGLDSMCVRVGGAHIWARGSGHLLVTAYGLDRAIQVVQDVLPLSTAPGQELLSKFDLAPVENFTMRFETAAPGDWFELSGFRPYMKPSAYNR